MYVDDVYITLSYARNLAAGKGLVFQPGERVFGCTSPLWCFLNAAGFWIGGGDRIAGAAGCRLLFLAFTGMAAFALQSLCRVLKFGNASWIAAIAFVLTREHVNLFGGETSLAILLAACFLITYARGSFYGAGVLGVALGLARPDAALLPVVTVLLHLVFRRSFRGPMRMALPPLLILPPLLLLSWHFYGSPLPDTLAAKQAQMRDLPWSVSVAHRAFAYVRDLKHYGHFHALVLALGSVTCAVLLLRRRQMLARGGVPPKRRIALLALLLWPVLHVAVLTSLGVASYGWYLYPLWMVVPVLLAAGVYGLEQIVHCYGPRGGAHRFALKALGAGGASLFLLHTLLAPWRGPFSPRQRDRHDGYAQVARYVAGEAKGRPVEVWAHEVGVLRFMLPENARVIDGYYVVRKLPDSGRIPSPPEQIASVLPDYVLESHPKIANATSGTLEYQRQRLAPDFTWRVMDLDGRPREYRPVLRLSSGYGHQVLMRRFSKE